jgi:hypothetical protein
MSLREIEAPPYEEWSTFEPRFDGGWKQGQHCLFVGPAGSGKTVAARVLARKRDYVCALGTKMRDPEMDAYEAEGYVRIQNWPPTKQDYKKGRWPAGVVRFVLWPDIKTREDLRRFRPVYAKAFDEMLVDGGWTIVADEGLWLSDRKGLDLGEHLGAIAYTGRSSGVTLMMLVQRPSGVPRNTWSNASYAFIWHAGVSSDLLEMARLGTNTPKDVQAAIGSLAGHQFLFLPCRAGTGWAVSEVDLTVPTTGPSPQS